MDINKPINSDQFVRLLTPNQKRILAFILSYVPKYSDAEDILQNTLSILWRKYQDYKPGTDFLAWSLTVARYEIMRYLRDCKTKGKLHFDERLYHIIETESSCCLDAFDDRLDALRKCVKKPPTDDTRLLKMRYEQELTFVKIGQRLGLSSVAAFKMIGKIHDRLVRCIRLHVAVREEA